MMNGVMMNQCEECPLNTANLRHKVYCLPVDILSNPGLHELCNLNKGDMKAILLAVRGKSHLVNVPEEMFARDL